MSTISNLMELYEVQERVDELLKKYKTNIKLLDHLEKELLELEDLWSTYSYDYIAHAMNFNELAIKYIKESKLSYHEKFKINVKRKITKITGFTS